MKKKEVMQKYGICSWYIEMNDRAGGYHMLKMTNKCYFDQDGNPVADKSLVIRDISRFVRRMDICCNPFDKESVRRAAEKYMSMEYSGGEITVIAGSRVALYHAVSPSQFNIVEVYFDVNDGKIHREMYKVADKSFEEVHHTLDIPGSCSVESMILEVVRGTFKSLGYIKKRLEDDVTVNFTCLDSKAEKLRNIKDDEETDPISSCVYRLSDFYYFSESYDESKLIKDCIFKLGSYLPKTYLLERIMENHTDMLYSPQNA